MSIIEIDLDTIRVVWSGDLWRHRQYIPRISTMLYWDGDEHRGGNHQGLSLELADPVYYAATNGVELMGVNSYHRVGDGQIRSRGLYVYPEYRGLGIGQRLLRHVINNNVGDLVWSLPREESLSTYLGAGFDKTSQLYTGTLPDGNLTGQDIYNCYVRA